MKDLRGKLALITGASRGIGLVFPRLGEWIAGKVGAYHVGQSVLKEK